MAITSRSSQRANLSSQYLKSNWPVPDLLRNDYISGEGDVRNLFNNDIELQAQITIIEGEIDDIEVRLLAVEILADSNEVRLNLLEPRVAQNETDITTNAANITTNTTNIATNTSAIADINDGRYSPLDGSGSPEGITTANNSKQYIDTAAGQTYYNPVIGANTGWILS